MSKPAASIEILEFGSLLMARRSKLFALANWMTEDEHEADFVVRQAMSVVWRSCDSTFCRSDLTPKLYGLVREGLRRSLLR